MFQYDINLWQFAILNLLSILLVGVVYFVVKEIYRIRGGNLSKLGIAILGTLIGLIVMMIHIYVSMEVYMSHDSWLIWGEDINAYLIYNGLLFSPSIIVIIMFVTFTDRRLIIPLFLMQFVALIIKTPLAKDNPEIEQAVVFTSLIFDMIQYLILAILLYFIPSINFIKKNAVKILISTLIYFVVLFSIQSISYETIISMDVNGGEGVGADWIDPVNWVTLQLAMISYLTIYTLLLLSLILFVEKVYSNFSALETFSTQDDVSYYKMSLAQNKLLNIIDEKKIRFGIVVLFHIKTDDDIVKSRALEKIRIGTENKYNTTFFFKASANYNGAFYELPEDFGLEVILGNNKHKERTSDDQLVYISNELNRISDDISVPINAAGSIYGVHSNSIPELIEHARFLMSPIVSRANSNSLIVYDFKRVRDRLNETNQVRNLPVDIEKMNVSYLRGVSSEEVFYPSITFEENENKLFEIINDESLTEVQKNILLRYVAYQSLRRFEHKDASLVLYYPMDYLGSEDFRIKDFIKKLNRYIDNDKAIIGFDTSIGNFNELFDDNIASMRNAGIKFAITNPSTVSQEEHDRIEPDFILDPIVDKNPLRIKKIKLEIKTNAKILNPNLLI